MTNLRIWDALKRTDPKHTKPFQRSGGFRGTAIKPIYCTQRLTELFGPCGLGWGMDKPEFQVVPAGDEIAVYCTVGLWYIDGGIRAQVYGVGGDFVVKKNKNGLQPDDEAFKKSYTDGLSNAMKQIGVGADVHMGQFEDNKYVSDLKEEFQEKDARKGQETFAAAVEIAIVKSSTLSELGAVFKNAWPEIKLLPEDLQSGLIATKDARKALLSGESEAA